MMILMCKKYDIPINYKDLGIIQDDTEQDEDSLWGLLDEDKVLIGQRLESDSICPNQWELPVEKSRKVNLIMTNQREWKRS